MDKVNKWRTCHENKKPQSAIGALEGPGTSLGVEVLTQPGETVPLKLFPEDDEGLSQR